MGDVKPGGVGGPPADVVVSVIWRSVTRVNVVDQTFDAELNIKATAHGGERVLDPSFRGPELKVMNAASIDVINTPEWQLKANGDMVEELQVRGTFTSHFDMDYFPLDTQELSVHIQCDRAVLVPGPNVTTKQVVRLVVADADDPVPCTLVETGVTIAPTLYHTKLVRIQAGHSDPSDSSRGNVYSKIHSSLVIERQPGFFWWNAIFPTFLFTNLTFLSLAIPPDQPADRLGVTIALILTGGAYKIIAAAAVPEIPHLTLLDQYVVASLIITSLVAVQNTIGELTDDENMDRLCGYVLMALWACFNLFYIVQWKFVQKFRRRLRYPTTLLQTDSRYLSDDFSLKSVPKWELWVHRPQISPKRASTFYSAADQPGFAL